MPNRIVRESLLDSDRWLGLRDNTTRVCYLALILKADDVGNVEGTEFRLRRMWRDYGIDSEVKVNTLLAELVDADLVRVYVVGDKRYVHIPRFGQFIRHIRQRHPSSPWDDSAKIQKVAEKTQCERTAEASRSHPEEKRSEEKRSEEKKNKGPAATLPGWLPSASWEEFKKHRIAIKKRMTDLAESKTLKELDSLRQKGHDPVKVLERSIQHGWAGVFPLKDEPKSDSVPYV
jgi:hypothetical protein